MSREPGPILIDGMPGEVVPAAPPGGPAALGRDPFADATAPEPFSVRLDSLRAPARSLRAAPRPPTHSRRILRRADPQRAPVQPPPPPLRRPGAPRPPRVGEVELPHPPRWAERLLGEDERKRLSVLSHFTSGGGAYDRFGFSPETARRAFLPFLGLYRLYFRVRSTGHENIPGEGPAILAANHGGLLPFDGAMSVIDVLLHTDPPRLVRTVVDRWAGTLPWVNVFFARVGQVVGTRENMQALLDEGQIVQVFPEGMDGIRKRITQRYRLQRFRVGFVEQALKCRAPIVPVAFIGTDDQAPILYDIRPLARWLGLPTVPITPTFPWLGPLGLLPYPVRYRIVYGEPLNFHERFGPEGAEDTRLVRYLANQVRRAVQQLVDRSR